MGVVGRIAVNGDVWPFKGSGRNYGDVRNLVETSHADGDVAARGDGFNFNFDGATFTNQTNAVKHTVLADGNVGTWFGAHFVCGHADGEDGHVADIVGGRNHAERHDGTVAQGVVGLPVVFIGNTALVAIGMGIANGEVADERDGGDAVEFIVVPNGIVNTICSLLVCRHLAKHVGGTHAKVVVLIPVSAGTGANVGICAFGVGTNHGFAKACAIIAPVGGQAAVAHG